MIRSRICVSLQQYTYMNALLACISTSGFEFQRLQRHNKRSILAFRQAGEQRSNRQKGRSLSGLAPFCASPEVVFHLLVPPMPALLRHWEMIYKWGESLSDHCDHIHYLIILILCTTPAPPSAPNLSARTASSEFRHSRFQSKTLSSAYRSDLLSNLYLHIQNRPAVHTASIPENSITPIRAVHSRDRRLPFVPRR